MKETKIAKENVERIKELIELTGEFFDDRSKLEYGCQEHKQTCQRWLEKDKNKIKRFPRILLSPWCFIYEELLKEIEDKEKAIKLYEENGI